MPELPDIANYLDALERHVGGRELLGFRLGSPFVLRTVTPAPQDAVGLQVADVSRIGKRIVLRLVRQGPGEGDHTIWFVIHLMIAGRLRWRKAGAKLTGRRGLAALDFENGTLLFTEEGRKKRAWLRVIDSTDELDALDPGGVDVFDLTPVQFADALTAENRTLKRSLTDPRIFSGIGNAYSDEILHRARLSPFRRTRQLTSEEMERLHAACIDTLTEWIDRIREQTGEGFPEKVTAFREGMAVHGRFGQPCPACGAPVQRIIYAEREANYCPGCQTEGRVLADRSLSRLLKDDWPRTLDELEQLDKRRSGR